MGSGPRQRPIAILVVDDEALVRMMVSDVLDEAGYQTLEACDAKEALILLKARPEIEVVFTDWNMPGGIDGLGLARLVHMRWPAKRIIVTSGRRHPSRLELPAGAQFIRKPYLPSMLIEMVEDLLQDQSEVEAGGLVIPQGAVSHTPSSHATGGGNIAGPPLEADKT